MWKQGKKIYKYIFGGKKVVHRTKEEKRESVKMNFERAMFVCR